MERVTADEIERYLADNYLTLDALAEAAGTTPERLRELLVAQCVPPHSHEVRGVMVYTSTFGDTTATLPVRRYYHPSLAAWAKKALDLARRHSLADVARRMRKDFEQAFADALDGREPPWPGGIDHAWGYIMDGTWGLCLKEISARNLLQKEFARQEIAGFAGAEDRLSPEARTRLASAIARYEEVAAGFGPHEIAASSRRLEVEAAIEKFRLAAPAPLRCAS